MFGTLVEFIEINEGVNYLYVFITVAVLIFVFSIAIALLTARDSRQRYENKYWSVFWFLVVFLFGIVGIIIYLLARPEDTANSSHSEGGLNIPVANFTGDNGEILMSFQLKVNSIPLADQVRDMRLDIDWESQDPNKELSASSIVEETKEVEEKITRLQLVYENLKAGITKLADNSATEKKESKTEKKKDSKKDNTDSKNKTEKDKSDIDDNKAKQGKKKDRKENKNKSEKDDSSNGDGKAEDKTKKNKHKKNKKNDASEIKDSIKNPFSES